MFHPSLTLPLLPPSPSQANDCPDIDSVHNDLQRHLIYFWAGEEEDWEEEGGIGGGGGLWVAVAGSLSNAEQRAGEALDSASSTGKHTVEAVAGSVSSAAQRTGEALGRGQPSKSSRSYPAEQQQSSGEGDEEPPAPLSEVE